MKRGKVAKHAQDPSDFCRLCSCSFKIRFGNNEKATSMSSENIFKSSKKKGHLRNVFLGLQVEMLQRLSTRDAAYVTRASVKYEVQTNILSSFVHVLQGNHQRQHQQIQQHAARPKRFKRSLPTTISTCERSPRQAKKSKPKSFSCPKKSLNFDRTKTRTTMKQQSLVTALSALNIDELIERSSTQGCHCFSQRQSGNSKLF